MKSTKQIKLTETKIQYMTDDIQCLKWSPNGQYYAVALLDQSVKVFFADSDKIFLQLYGHKLPVLGFDISSDN